MVVQLLAGMFLGSIFVSLIWGIFLKSSKKKAEKSRREREAIMRSLGELWAEVDELFSSHRSGTIEDQKFRDAFSSKIEAINRGLKPHLYLLDVYYVKYMENLILEYSRAVEKGEQPLDAISGTASDSEMETDISVVEQAGTADFSKTSVAIADGEKESSDSGIVMEEAAAGISVAVPESEELFAVGEEEPPFAPETRVFTPTAKPDTGTPGAVADEVSELEVTIPAEKEAAIPETDRMASDVLPVSTASEEEIIIEKAAAPLKEEEPVSFEVRDINEVEAEDPALRDKETERTSDAVSSVEEEITFEKSSEAAGATILVEEETTAFDSDKKSFVVPHPAAEKEPESDLFGEEDFSMETLIDVDINTISPFLKDGAATTPPTTMEEPEVSLFEVSTDKGEPPESAGTGESLEVVIASNVSHTGTPEKEESKATVLPEVTPVKKDKKSKKSDSKQEDVIPEETTYTRAEDLAPEGRSDAEPAPDEDFVEMFEQAPVAETPVQKTETSPEKAFAGVTDADLEAFDREEEVITGDDVADKIASLEFHKQTPSAKPAKKEKKKEKAASVKTTAAKSSAHSGKKSSASASSKKKADDDTITGDDVADKIDAFFGLFEKQ